MCDKVVDKDMRTVSQKSYLSYRFLGNLRILLQNLVVAFRTLKSILCTKVSTFLTGNLGINRAVLNSTVKVLLARLQMIDVHQKHIWPLGKEPLKGVCY